MPVAYGETISRTGEMVVRCDGSYILSQDGVGWSPVGSFEGADEYVIASAGRFSIKHDGREIFFFTVTYDADFRLSTNNLRQLDSNGNAIDYVRGINRYAQTTMQDELVKLTITIAASDMSSSDIIDLGYETNQPDANFVSRVSGDYAYYEVTSINKTMPFWLRVGNVMIAFCNPVA